MLVLLVIITALSMDLLDMTIVNVAIPKLMAVFTVDINRAQWVATAYMMSVGIIIPITAYLADTFGMKRIFIASMVFFAVGSLLCGLAWSLDSLIVFRIIQGMGGGMIMPLAIAVIYKIFSEEERGLAMGIMGLPLLVAPAVGPVLGGYLVEHTDWRLIFLINIPVGIVAIMLAYMVLKEFEKYRVALDLPGFIFSAAGLAGLLLALSNGPVDGWKTPYVVYLLITALFLLVLFILWEFSVRQPLLDLRLFSIPVFCCSVLLSVFSIMAIMGSLFLLPVFLQNLRGYGPFQTGLLMVPEAVAAAVMLPVSGVLVNRINPAFLAVPGMVMITYITYCLSKINLHTGDTALAGLLAFLGAAMGLGLMPAMTAGLNAVPERLTGQGSSLLNIVRQVGSSFSIAILSSVLQKSQDVFYIRVAEGINVTSQVAVDFLPQAACLLEESGLAGVNAWEGAVMFLYLQAKIEALMLAFHETFGIAAFFGFLGIFPALAFIFLRTARKFGEKNSKILHF
jgi:EmrB/QacA subfamily drug resistance transporter